MAPNAPGPANSPTFSRSRMIVGISFALGLSTGLLSVAIKSVFLATHDASFLSYVYIALAVVSLLVFSLFGRALGKLTLPSLSMVSMGLITAIYGVCWSLLYGMGWDNVTYALMVIAPLHWQLGYVILSTLSEKLFNIREVKEIFPRIMAGMAVGTVVGGLAAPHLATLLLEPAHVLLPGMAITLIMLLSISVTGRRFPDRFEEEEEEEEDGPSTPMSQLLLKPVILILVVYQLISNLSSELLDYAVLAEASERFPDEAELTQFLGNLTALGSGAAILFLTFLAAPLLKRFGLWFGLNANAVAIGLLLLCAALLGAFTGTGVWAFLGLLSLARIIDEPFADGATEPSVNTVYQSLPEADRNPAQTVVEGIGVPFGVGVAGVLLLLVEEVFELGIVAVLVLTLALIVGWLILGSLVYRNYTGSLMTAIRRRHLNRERLHLDDASTMAALTKLLMSDEVREVRLGLEILRASEHASRSEHLLRLAAHRHAPIRRMAWEELESAELSAEEQQQALLLCRSAIQNEKDPPTRGAALSTFASLVEEDPVEVLEPYVQAKEEEVRRAAFVGLLRRGGIAGVLAAGNRLTELGSSDLPLARAFVARVIGEVAISSFYRPLVDLLEDPALEVRQAALEAAPRLLQPRLIPALVRNLDDPRTRSAALLALVASGDHIAPVVERALRGEESLDQANVERLLRASARIGGARILGVLKAHLRHRDRDRRRHVHRALSLAGYRHEDVEEIEALLEEEIEHIHALLASRYALGDEPRYAMLVEALRVELDDSKMDIFHILSLIYERDLLIPAANRIVRGRDEDARALAMETMEVTLNAKHKGYLFPVIDEKMPEEQRLLRLSGFFGTARAPVDDATATLIELIQGAGQASPTLWMRACAVHAAGVMGLTQCVTAIEIALDDDEEILRETAAWALGQVDPERLDAFADAIAADSSPRVARFAPRVAQAPEPPTCS